MSREIDIQNPPIWTKDEVIEGTTLEDLDQLRQTAAKIVLGREFTGEEVEHLRQARESMDDAIFTERHPDVLYRTRRTNSLWFEAFGTSPLNYARISYVRGDFFKGAIVVEYLLDKPVSQG